MIETKKWLLYVRKSERNKIYFYLFTIIIIIIFQTKFKMLITIFHEEMDHYKNVK